MKEYFFKTKDGVQFVSTGETKAQAEQGLREEFKKLKDEKLIFRYSKKVTETQDTSAMLIDANRIF